MWHPPLLWDPLQRLPVARKHCILLLLLLLVVVVLRRRRLRRLVVLLLPWRPTCRLCAMLANSLSSCRDRPRISSRLSMLPYAR